MNNFRIVWVGARGVNALVYGIEYTTYEKGTP